MNDPLQDNRIFPEEMQQKPVQLTKDRTLVTWLLPLIVVIALLALGYLGYQHYKKTQNAPVNLDTDPVYQEQLMHFNNLQKATPEYTEAQREKKIEVFFGSTE